MTSERITINVSHGDQDNEGNKLTSEVILNGDNNGIFTTLLIEEMVTKCSSDERNKTRLCF